MKFEYTNISEWLTFVIDSNDKELLELISDDFQLTNNAKERTSVEKDNLVLTFQKRLQNHVLEERIWEATLFHYPCPLPDEICSYLIENNVALTILGHTRQSDKIMWRLGKLVEEAALTLGKEIYGADKYSLQNLEQLLKKFNNNEWLWNSLLYENPSSIEKQELFFEHLEKHESFDDVKQNKRILDIEHILLATDSLETIRKYYAEENPVFYKAIAQNPNSPIELLHHLSIVEGIKFARSIRSLATITIENRDK